MSLARRIGSNIIATAAARFAVLLVWFLATPPILEALGPERFGLWSILFVVTQILATLDFGIGTAVARALGELMGRRAFRSMRPLLARALAVQTALVLVLGALAFLGREPVLAFFPIDPQWLAEARDAYALTVLAFCAGAGVNLLLSSLQGLQRMDLAARVFVPASIALFVGIRWAVADPAPLRALTIVQAAYAFLVAIATAVAVALVLRSAERSAEPGPAVPVSWRDLLGLGSWIQLTSLFGLVQNNLDKILIGRLVSLLPVASFEIAARIVQVSFLPALFFHSAFLPALARHEAEASPDARADLRRVIYRTALGPYSLFVIGVTGGLVALAPSLLQAWLGREPELGVLMLRTVAVAFALNYLVGIVGTMLRSANEAHEETAYAAGMVLLHVALSIGGFRLFGVRGILAGAVVSALAGGLWYVARFERRLGLVPLQESASALVGPVVAATAGILAVLLLGELDRSARVDRMAGAARLLGFGSVYLVTALATYRLGFPAAWKDNRARLGRVLAGFGDLAR